MMNTSLSLLVPPKTLALGAALLIALGSWFAHAAHAEDEGTAQLAIAKASHAFPRALDALVTVPTERPHDPWVFRCVLDDNPRSVVVALHESLWLAYRSGDGTLARAWSGGVRFTGSVYDAAHGPQPLARGATHLQTTRSMPFRVQLAGDQERSARATWLGYRLDGERSVALRWRLALGEERSVVVEELPEAMLASEGGGQAVGLLRRFRLFGEVPQGTSVRVVIPDRDAGGEAVALRGYPAKALVRGKLGLRLQLSESKLVGVAYPTLLNK